MDLQQIKQRYENIPKELKQMKRWVGFKVEGMENGKQTKRPYNALSGKLARVNDDLTWTNFDIAMAGCAKYGFDGIGFILGNGIFGIDLDNHIENPDEEERFKEISNEFITTLNSYTEYSQSGKGVHIICAGKLPEGSRRKGCVEMYDSGRFFAFTGNAILNVPIFNREQEIIPLWEKYVKSETTFSTQAYQKEIGPNQTVLKLSDEEIIDTALASKSGGAFYKYYHDGDISANGYDASKADMSFCNMLAFWCNKDAEQMDRIFRNSALMRDKWDSMRGSQTYGQMTIDDAIRHAGAGYVRTQFTNGVTIRDRLHYFKQGEEQILEDDSTQMTIDENGEPIFKDKIVSGHFPYNDTGNAERFYRYYGDLFKYNVTDKIYMYWTGKTWIRDDKDIIRKYVNHFIQHLKKEEQTIQAEIEELATTGQAEQVKLKEKQLDACQKNTARVSNKAGKDALLSELKSLHDIPVSNDEFNADEYLLNTDSGIVDLREGAIMGFDRSKLMSLNTNVKVSFEEPTVWIKFLHDIFPAEDMITQQEMIDFIQTALGYSLSGSTKEQVMFLLHGMGANGKSTLTETIAYVFGDYSNSIDSNTLMQQKNQNSSATYSIAKLQSTRFLRTGETDEGGQFAESKLKSLTGGDEISAQFKYGNEFNFRPKFKIWMSTNNLPYIRDTTNGTWRRLLPIAFKRNFAPEEQDRDLERKLRAEADKILGWCIQGFMKYQELGKLPVPSSIENTKSKYRAENDRAARFIEDECDITKPDAYIECKVLFAQYQNWAKITESGSMRKILFEKEIEKKGFKIKEVNGKLFFIGIRLSGTVSVGGVSLQ